MFFFFFVNSFNIQIELNFDLQFRFHWSIDFWFLQKKNESTRFIVQSQKKKKITAKIFKLFNSLNLIDYLNIDYL